MKRSLIIKSICWAVITCMLYGAIRTSYYIGWNAGADVAYKSALDTVTATCKKQYLSDTSITDLVIINPDTFHVYLSRKTAILK